MFENWQKPVSTEKLYDLFLRISLIHEIKQNEKYPYAYNFHKTNTTNQQEFNYYKTSNNSTAKIILSKTISSTVNTANQQ